MQARRPNSVNSPPQSIVPPAIAILVAVSLAFSLASVWGVAVSIGFWVASVAVFQRMGKADPMMRQIYMRHIRYKPFYPAKSGLYSACLQTPAKWR